MPLHLALVHYPILGRDGAPICTSVTNLDVHDAARAGTTYGTRCVWIVHPYAAQHRFLGRVLRHWREGHGAVSNPTRQQSLAQTRLAWDMGEVAREVEVMDRRPAVLVGTSARPAGRVVSFADLRRRLDDDPAEPIVLVFGTGSGLHPDLVAEMDLMLEPIYGPGPWNHLSVRAAMGIILDRLRGRH